MTEIRFEGIDSWNRPVFKSVHTRERFGSVNVLFDFGTIEENVVKKINESDLCYFGNSFGCEPMGYAANDIKIVPNLKKAPRKKKEPKSNADKIREAVKLISKAKDMIDEVLGKSELKDFRFVSNYYAYNRYGIDQAMGTGNPLDDCIFTLIKEIEKEEL